MFYINYEQDCFTLNPVFDEFVDREVYNEVVLYLKQLFIQFDFSLKKWKIPTDRIDEVLLWFQKDNKEYEISNTCADAIENLQHNYDAREVKFIRGLKFDSAVLKEGVTAFNYQIESINWNLQRNAYQDAHDAGLGKTFINICTLSTLYNKNLIDGIILLVPIGMGFHWKCQILEFSNQFIEDDIQIIDNSLKIKPFDNFKDKKILIIRHDMLANVLASYNKNYAPKKSLKNLKWKSADYVDIKKEWCKNNLAILVDESHGFKHTTSVKTKALHSIKKYFDYRFMLSATPAINGVEDLYSSLYFVDKTIIPMSENAFRLWIANSIGNKWDKYAIKSYNSNNVQQLMQSYQHVFIQKRKEDIPEIKTQKIFKRVECEMTPAQTTLYQRVVERELSVLKEEYDEITWKLLLSKLHIIMEVFDNPELLKKRQYDDIVINNILDKWTIEKDNKFQILKSRIEEIIDVQDKKAIIYDIHPDTINVLAEKFKKYNPLIVHGALKVKDKDVDRKEKEDLFNYNNKHKLMILSMFTSSQGINLQKGGNNIIFNSLSWDATLYEQAQNRTDRATSTNDSIIEMLYYPYTLDAFRLNKNIRRINLNSKMNKVLTQRELEYLLNGDIDGAIKES